MDVIVGDIITVNIIEVLPYACWGELNGQICFAHVTDWSNERPVSEEKYPNTGQKLKAKVFYIADNTDDPQPADVTLDGKYHVDFAVSFALLKTENQAAENVS